jgi:hypothetical protein
MAISQRLSPSTDASSNPVVNYLRALKWVPIPLGVGFAYIGYQQFGHIRKREQQIIQNAENPEDIVASEWQVGKKDIFLEFYCGNNFSTQHQYFET